LGRLDICIGNTCNLKCRICSPDESSRYIKEWHDLFGHKGQIYDVIGSHADLLSDLILESDLINIAGGEPLLSMDHFDLLDAVPSDKASFVKLQYHTNGTIAITPKMIETWSRFKKVVITYSIDGIGKKFEYNRHPAQWEQVAKNIIDLLNLARPNIEVNINTVLSIFTIDALIELFDWTDAYHIPPPHLHILRQPEIFQVSVLPQVLTSQLKIKLLKSRHLRAKSAIGFLNADRIDLLPKLKERIILQDRYRKESFAEVFPDIAGYIFG